MSDQSSDSEESSKGQAGPSSSRRITQDSFGEIEEHEEDEGEPEEALEEDVEALEEYLEYLSPTTRNLRPEIQGSQLEESQLGTAGRQLLFESNLGQQTSDIRAEEEDITMAQLGATKGALPTVHGSAADMFKVADPVDKATLAGGSCELPRSQRGTDAKTIAKSKERACAGLKVKFDLNYYQVSGKFTEEDDSKSMATKSTQDAIISVTYICEELKSRIKAFDLRNACLVPTLKDKNEVHLLIGGTSEHEDTCWTIMVRSLKKRFCCGAMIVCAGASVQKKHKIKNGYLL